MGKGRGWGQKLALVIRLGEPREGKHDREGRRREGPDPTKLGPPIKNLLRTALSIFSASTLDLNVWRPTTRQVWSRVSRRPELF
jgi:hypothetical protein